MARFGREILRRLVYLMPEHEWVIVLDGRYAVLPFELPRSEVVRVPVSSHHPPGMLVYLEYWLPLVAEKKRTSALLSPDGWSPLTLKLPVVPVIHDINFERQPSWIAWHWRHLYRFYFPRITHKAYHIFTVSDFSRKELTEIYGLKTSSVTVVPNGAADIFRPLTREDKKLARGRFSGGRPYVLVPTSLHPRKNASNVLKAYQKVLKDNPTFPSLLFTGGILWSDSRLESEIRHLQDSGKIVMLGLLSERDMALAVGGAEAVLYVSLYEGFGLPVIEAQAAGVPVLTSSSSALPETGGDGCLYANPENPEEIAEKLIALCSDEILRQSLVEKGFHNVRRYSWDKTAGIMAETFNKLFAA